MTTTGPDTQSYDFKHMYSFTDYNGKKPELCILKNSIYDILKNNGGFTRFLGIAEKADRCVRINDIQADCTIFVPHDKFLSKIPEQFFSEMDEGDARQIIKASTLRNKIDGELMRCSPVSYFATMNPKMRMYVTNISGKTLLNNCVSIIQYDVDCSNGLIHITDGLIVPTFDTFMN